MSFSEVDRQLLQRCLDGTPRAWHDFIDRFLGLVVHVANHTANSRGVVIDGATREDLVAEVFLTLVADDYGVLRRFRRNCSLATYLTVIARRVIVRRLIQASAQASSLNGSAVTAETNGSVHSDQTSVNRVENHEQVEQLLLRLDPKEASVVRMYHLEGKSYQEISSLVGMSENSIGPVLSRARQKMRGGEESS